MIFVNSDFNNRVFQKLLVDDKCSGGGDNKVPGDNVSSTSSSSGPRQNMLLRALRRRKSEPINDFRTRKKVYSKLFYNLNPRQTSLDLCLEVSDAKQFQGNYSTTNRCKCRR